MDVPTFRELFRQIKINLWLSGITVNDTKIQSRFYIHLVLISVVLVGELAFLFSRFTAEDFLELTQLIPCFCIGLISILKIIPIAANRKKIFNLTKCLDELDSAILANPSKKAVVKSEVYFLKKLIKYFFILNGTLISVYNFSSLLIMLYYYTYKNKVVYRLPYPIIVPFPMNSWSTWFIAYIQSITGGFICIFFVTTVDALYCVLTSHVCNNFTVIGNEMKRLDESNVDLLKDLVKNHQYILKLSEDLEEIFKWPNLFNFLVGSIEICALGFNLTTGDVFSIPRYLLFILSVLLQILIMSYFGQKLIEESRNVGDAVFECKWYNMDTKSKKIILFIIIRAQKQQQLTAYKFSVISYKSFTKIISTSWSYFTILRTVYNPSESVQVE